MRASRSIFHTLRHAHAGQSRPQSIISQSSENSMSRLFIALVMLSSAGAFAGGSAHGPNHPAGYDPVLIAMGPDPGGHTGARVTPDTTKTDRPAVDAARKEASGSNVENSSAENSGQSSSAKSGTSRKPGN
jgi:hypothetical protein